MRGREGQWEREEHWGKEGGNPNAEPNAGLDPKNHDIKMWAKIKSWWFNRLGDTGAFLTALDSNIYTFTSLSYFKNFSFLPFLFSYFICSKHLVPYSTNILFMTPWTWSRLDKTPLTTFLNRKYCSSIFHIQRNISRDYGLQIVWIQKHRELKQS